MSGRPLCRCHGEPMHRDGFYESGKQKWRCAITHCQRRRRVYENESGYAYNYRLLKLRRWKALKRLKAKAVAHG